MTITLFSEPNPLTLIDIGVNLTNKAFSDDRNEVIQRAITAGISRMIVTGTNLQESQQAAKLANSHPGVIYSTAGVHPHEACHYSDSTVSELQMITQGPGVKAIGECGLDFNRMFSTKEQQIKAFESQIELAISLQMPLFLHERDAHISQHEMLSYYRDQLPATVIHCFTGEQHEAFRYLDLDLYIGITGWICDERRGHHLHQFVGDIPLNRLMIETDSPYLIPRVKPKPKLKSSRRNEPCTLPLVLIEIAKHSPHSIELIAETTTANAIDFFNLPKN